LQRYRFYPAARDAENDKIVLAGICSIRIGAFVDRAAEIDGFQRLAK